MEPEDRKLLEETLKLSKENNKMLHKIRGVQKWQAFWSMLRIVIILGIALGAAYYLEPYFEKAVSIFNQVSSMNQSVSNISLEKLLKNINP